MNHFWLVSLLSLSLCACSVYKPPKEPFTAYPIPAAPDYRDTANWAALPQMRDLADTLPKDLVEGQLAVNPAVDVFFIHPTTFLEPHAWNAEMTDKELNLSTDDRPIKHQATVFNGSARIYAPRYRQMTLGGFYSEDRASMAQALNLAYTDVKAAFDYYLEHYNDGRPIIIGAHSQGSVHGVRLIKEYFDGTAMQDQFVVAYLLGWPFPADTFETIPICEDPTQTGCAIGWCSWATGTEPRLAQFFKKNLNFEGFYEGAVAVNPLTWTRDTALAPPSQHEAILMPNFKTLKRQHLDVQVKEGYLWVSKPLPLLPQKNYHIGDYNLFWLDIRHNVAARVEAYLDQGEVMNR